MFTEKELKLLEWALQEICPWLESEDDFEDFNNICRKLNLTNLLTDEQFYDKININREM